MTNEILTDQDFQSLLKEPPKGWRMSERVLAPVLTLRRVDDHYAAELGGRRGGRNGRVVLLATTPAHNWVADGQVIRPLPQDIGEVVSSLLFGRSAENLSFVDVVELVRTNGDLIDIEIDDSVFIPARTQAESLEGSTAIPGLRAELYGYQAQGVRWMLDTIRHTRGLVLADEMGLGKTVQLIAMLLVEQPTDAHPALIVCPTSLIANWRSEIFRFSPELSVLVHRGAQRTGVASGLQRAQVVITTYDTLVSDVSIFQSVRWSWLILDEAQALKNPDSARRVAVSGLNRERTVPVTGTPVETSLVDLWSLVDIAIPGILGSRETFEERFGDTEQSARTLAAVTDSIVLRRRLADVANELPPRLDIDVPLELGAELSDAYRKVRDESLARYPVAGPLVATGQLQLFCAHPWLVTARASPDGGDSATVHPTTDVPLVTPKIERTVSILREAFLSDRKVLIFALFNRCADLILEALGPVGGLYWDTINGSTEGRIRQSIIDNFAAHVGPACLVLNPKAAGAGLNIIAATVVIHYTLAWNPALELQASARAHRRGQTSPVTIYRLFYEDTVERVMLDRSMWRAQLGNDAVPVSSRDEADLRRALEQTPMVTNG